MHSYLSDTDSRVICSPCERDGNQEFEKNKLTTRHKMATGRNQLQNYFGKEKNHKLLKSHHTNERI